MKNERSSMVKMETSKFAVINGDCPYGKRLINPPQVRVITFGMKEGNDFRAILIYWRRD